MDEKNAYLIEFQPLGRRGKCPSDKTLWDCARELGIGLASLCGGEGHCGRCRVKVLLGQVSTALSDEEATLGPEDFQAGYRLACRTYPRSDCTLHVPPESLSAPQRTQVEGEMVSVQGEPLVRAVLIQVHRPDLQDLRSDDKRLLDALRDQNGVHGLFTDLDALRALPASLQAHDGQSKVALRSEEIVAVNPPDTPVLGLAVDLGTTKIAGFLVDLETGRTLASEGIMNPQISYGEDVISRIHRCVEDPSACDVMQRCVVEALNDLCRSLTALAQTDPRSIVEAVLVGNTAMHHLLLKLPVRQLGLSPYVPVLQGAVDLKSREIGLMLAPGSYLHLLPNIAGFVGADHVAMVLATRTHRADGIVLALDIGTNTEICLNNQGKMASLSCASGAAFEGAHIKHGMRAANGAIERVRITDGRVEYQTIGDEPPAGICGSGILDALAQLRQAGLVDKGGRMGAHTMVREVDGRREFVLVGEYEREGKPAITITQKDVRELQLAKGAIRTGIQTLLQDSSITESDIDQVIVAGAFGTYIDITSAITIGMLPKLPLRKFRQVGNAAGAGARLALLSREERAEAQALARQIKYLELSTSPHFMELFTESLALG